jgi:hypothetical protein
MFLDSDSLQDNTFFQVLSVVLMPGQDTNISVLLQFYLHKHNEFDVSNSTCIYVIIFLEPFALFVSLQNITLFSSSYSAIISSFSQLYFLQPIL